MEGRWWWIHELPERRTSNIRPPEHADASRPFGLYYAFNPFLLIVLHNFASLITGTQTMRVDFPLENPSLVVFQLQLDTNDFRVDFRLMNSTPRKSTRVQTSSKKATGLRRIALVKVSPSHEHQRNYDQSAFIHTVCLQCRNEWLLDDESR